MAIVNVDMGKCMRHSLAPSVHTGSTIAGSAVVAVERFTTTSVPVHTSTACQSSVLDLRLLCDALRELLLAQLQALCTQRIRC